MSKKIAIVTGLVAMLSLAGGAAQAAPVTDALTLSPIAAHVEQVQFRHGWHGHREFRRHDWHHWRRWHHRHWRR